MNTWSRAWISSWVSSGISNDGVAEGGTANGAGDDPDRAGGAWKLDLKRDDAAARGDLHAGRQRIFVGGRDGAGGNRRRRAGRQRLNGEHRAVRHDLPRVRSQRAARERG